MKTIYFAHDQQESPQPRRVALEQAGFRVELFPSRPEVLEAVARGAPDLLLLDDLLEGGNGFATAAAARHQSQGSFPIVLCTRIYRARCFRDEALAAGCADLILLPVQRDAFLRRVHAALGGTEALRSAA